MPAPQWMIKDWPGGATNLTVRWKGTRDGKLIDEIRYNVTSLRTGAKALLMHVRDCWSIEIAGTGRATPSSRRTPPAIARPTAGRSWPRSTAWR